MSDEGDAADDVAGDGGDNEDGHGSGGRTALVTESAARPQRPSGKRSRQRAVDTDDDLDGDESSTEASAEASGAKKGKRAAKSGKVQKSKKSGGGSTNPIAFVYNYLKQVVNEMRKVIWPNRKQMISYTTVVLVFLAFMVALVALADLGLTKLVLLVFG
ncbi:preprotein translocase subunit SecE [Mycobacterium sp.]|uniref:preprotein translocase subunit SecE n=1 Tax=Mycobacterium sp. TaxID=1785 RepID=UPI003BAA3E04